MQMQYDFSESIDRSRLGSGKWNDMKRQYPNVPEGIVPLSVADMELKNPPEIILGLREFFDPEKISLGYTSPTEAYFDAVVTWMRTRHAWDVCADWVVLSPGVVSGFFNAVKAFSEPGDGVIIFSPVYYPFRMAIEGNGRKCADVPLVSSGTRYEIDFDGFETAAKSPENKLLLFCSPHNPVGRVWTETELRRVSEICLENNVLMLSDEIHNDLIMPGHVHTVYSKLSSDAEQNCVVFTAPSKTFNLAGLQSSNIFVPNEELRRRYSEQMFKSAQFTLNTVSYKACELAYTRCSQWLEQCIRLIDGNAKVVETYLTEKVPQIRVYPLEGTYLQWWDCRELFGNHKKMERFMQQKALMFLDEGYFFGKAGEGFERVNIACPRDVLSGALERLYTALDAEGII
jgi:aminotransferase/cystathionine beta-lyase